MQGGGAEQSFLIFSDSRFVYYLQLVMGSPALDYATVWCIVKQRVFGVQQNGSFVQKQENDSLFKTADTSVVFQSRLLLTEYLSQVYYAR